MREGREGETSVTGEGGVSVTGRGVKWEGSVIRQFEVATIQE